MKKEYNCGDLIIAASTGKRNPFPEYLLVMVDKETIEKDDIVVYYKKIKVLKW